MSQETWGRSVVARAVSFLELRRGTTISWERVS
jgi:hypothetical protein